jgi:hypothetical protein
MDELRELDKVAYVRFASVYRSSRTSPSSRMRSSVCRPSLTPVRRMRTAPDAASPGDVLQR